MGTRTFVIKRNDTSPSIQGTCKDADGNAVDITGATIRFHMIDADEDLIVDAAATIADGTGGVVRYDWQAADTDVAGAYQAEFEVTYSDATVESFPSRGFIGVQIYEDLA